MYIDAGSNRIAVIINPSIPHVLIGVGVEKG